MDSHNMSNHMFTSASNFTIFGGNFINRNLKESGLDKLSVAIAYSALHDAPARTDESRCHPHTRTNVLDHLEHWAQGICDEGLSVFWLHGGAGAGKSAIMQTLAERCAARGLALGSFFFSRSDPTRSTAEMFIPTLVYQVAQRFLAAMDVLGPIIDHDPLIFKKSLQVQLFSLFVQPLQDLVQRGIISDAPQSPRIFLIDGLDECSNPAQQTAIIQAVAAVCHEHRIPVKFLIASRLEPAISMSFRQYKQENRALGTISLSEDIDADDDVRRFITTEFLKIRSQHPFNQMLPLEWPSLYDINRLVWKSSSHFIYASTAMKYIGSPNESPVRSLQVILGLEVSRTTSPFAELDALYHHILGSVAHRDQVLQILAHCLFTTLSSSLSVVCNMLDCSIDDLHIYMADVTPLATLSRPSPHVFVPTQDEYVKLLHASIGDFLRDQSRSGSLYINEQLYLASKLERCFHLLDLYSQQQHTRPDWPIYDTPYFALKREVITTIEKTGHILVTQQVLMRYNFRHFRQYQQQFNRHHLNIWSDLEDLCEFFAAVHSIRTLGGLPQFPNAAEDFFNILESYLSSKGAPLVPAILPLIFLGYPVHAIRKILIATHFCNEPGRLIEVIGAMTPTDLASTRHNVNASPQRVALAAEAIVGHLLRGIKSRDLPAMYSAHKWWLQRNKPGKHVATGSPKLASAFRAQYLGPLTPPKNSTVLGRNLNDGEILRYRFQSSSMLAGQAVDLLKALLWVVPKAGFSEKIVFYSTRAFPRSIYHHNHRLIRRVHKCMVEYNTRVRGMKLKGLRERIESGDIDALIERSRMFFLDAQD